MSDKEGYVNFQNLCRKGLTIYPVGYIINSKRLCGVCMATSFKKQQYKDSTGKTPSDYLCELLEKDVDVIKLAIYIQKIPNEGVLFGKFLSNLKNPAIGIWVYSHDEYHLMYSYFKGRNEVCFLDVFKGNPKARISEAIDRIKQFYNI